MAFRAHPRPDEGHRSFNRLKLGVPATLVLPHSVHPCRIHDISRTGARLQTDRRLTAGQTVQLSFHELNIYASVVWTNEGECGLSFDSPLDVEDMEGMLWITENRELYERLCADRAE